VDDFPVSPDWHSVTIATPHESRTWHGRDVRVALDWCRKYETILYAPGSEWPKLRAILSAAGLPESAFARKQNGGYYIERQKDDGRSKAEPVAFEHPELPPLYFCKPLNSLHGGSRAAEVFDLLNFARSHGVAPDAPHRMAFELWKATWPTFKPGGFTPWYCQDAQYPNRPTVEAYRTLPLFGRDEAPRPGRYEHGTFYDKVAAYPSVMAHGGPFPWQLCKIDRLPERGEVGISRVTVHRVPDLLWSPLPYGRNVIAGSRGGWTHEPTADLWVPNRELLMALEYGVEQDAHEVYVGQYPEPRMFGAWFDLYQEAKRLPFGSSLAKWLFTRLWGQLSKNDDFLPIAVEITARLREQVYREALGNPEVGAVYVEVDGVIATGQAPPQPYGSGPGEWRMKPDDGPDHSDTWILGESTYAYWRDGRWRYHAEREQSDWHAHCERRGDELFANDLAWQERKRQMAVPRESVPVG